METPVAEKQIAPTQIMQVGMGFMAAKTLLAAVRFDLLRILLPVP
jgi:hypothetical protein